MVFALFRVYILSLILIGLLIFPVVRWVMMGRLSWLRNALGAVGCVLLVAHVALTALLISIGSYRTVTSLGHEGYYRYSDFRPVRVGRWQSGAALAQVLNFGSRTAGGIDG